jgi:hypothetical protein
MNQPMFWSRPTRWRFCRHQRMLQKAASLHRRAKAAHRYFLVLVAQKRANGDDGWNSLSLAIINARDKATSLVQASWFTFRNADNLYKAAGVNLLNRRYRSAPMVRNKQRRERKTWN